MPNSWIYPTLSQTRKQQQEGKYLQDSGAAGADKGSDGHVHVGWSFLAAVEALPIAPRPAGH